MSDFALPIDLGSTLISKVMETESAVFNSLVVMDHCKKVKSMEKKYTGKNPTLLSNESAYPTYGWSNWEHGLPTERTRNTVGGK
jgi:hypothetical protein